jgi:hypothetical protein
MTQDSARKEVDRERNCTPLNFFSENRKASNNEKTKLLILDTKKPVGVQLGYKKYVPQWGYSPQKTPKKNTFPYHYIFQYPLTNNMFRYLETKQLKNGGLNTLRVPKTGKVCHVFDPGAHTGRVEAKDGNIIETQHLNIESKHQLKAHCAII